MRLLLLTVFGVALLTGHAARADDLAARMDGTWVLSGVEEKDAAGNWVAREAPSIGMLIYGIVGPMSGQANSTGAGDPPAAPPPPAASLRAVMTLGEDRVRLLWEKAPAP